MSFSIQEFDLLQKELEVKYSDFLQSLDGRRTATISGLYSSLDEIRKVGACWLNQEKFLERLSLMCDFFSSLSGFEIPPYKIPLIFFQATSFDEDMSSLDSYAEVTGVRKSRSYKEVEMEKCPQVAYLHIDTNFNHKLCGTWAKGKRLIPPHKTYVNLSWRGVARKKPEINIGAGSVIGYRIPNYPELLGISRETATDYLVRIVVHDIGHCILPKIKRSLEPYHNAVMCQALGEELDKNYIHSFEELVSRECTDPLSIPYIFQFIKKELNGGILSPTQKFYLDRIGWTYFEDRYESFERMWGIRLDENPNSVATQMKRVLCEVISDNFTAFQARLR